MYRFVLIGYTISHLILSSVFNLFHLAVHYSIKGVSSNLEDDLDMSTSEAVYEQFVNYISYADMYTQLNSVLRR